MTILFFYGRPKTKNILLGKKSNPNKQTQRKGITEKEENPTNCHQFLTPTLNLTPHP